MPRASSMLSSAVASASSRSPACKRRVRAVEQIPGQPLGVAGEAGRLDRAVEQVRRLGQPAAHPRRRPERREEHGDDVALAGRAADPQRTLGVRRRLREAVEVQLRRREIGSRVEAQGELGVGQGIDERGRLGAMPLGLGDMPGERLRERECGDRRRRQRPVAERRDRVSRARSAQSRMESYSARYRPSTASSIMSAAASGESSRMLVERALQPCVRALVPAEQMLDRRPARS